MNVSLEPAGGVLTSGKKKKTQSRFEAAAWETVGY